MLKAYPEAWEWFKTQDDALDSILRILLPKDAIDDAIENLPDDYPLDELLALKPKLTEKRKLDAFKHASIAIDYHWLRSTGMGDLESRVQIGEKYFMHELHVFRILKKHKQI